MVQTISYLSQHLLLITGDGKKELNCVTDYKISPLVESKTINFVRTQGIFIPGHQKNWSIFKFYFSSIGFPL